jgi:hypothetical protein
MAGSISVTGEVTYSANNWPKLTTRTWTCHSFDIALTTFNNGTETGPNDPDIWVEKSNQGDAPCLCTRITGASGQKSVIEFKDLPPGGILSNMKIVTRGGTPAIPTPYPKYQIVRWQTGEDTWDPISAQETDEHASTADWETQNQETVVVTNTTVTIDRDFRYGLYVIHPYAATNSFMRILDCNANGTTDHIQNV